MIRGFVYVLQLENNKFYIGYTTKLSQRISQHCLGSGAKFTQLHKPVNVISVQEGNEYLEEATTVLYMNKYGWEHVRGSKWCAIDLKQPTF